MTPLRIGLLTSVPTTLDAFFPAWVREWRGEGHHVAPASGPGDDGQPARVEGAVVVRGVTRNPRLTSGTAHRHLRTWVRDERLDVVLTSTATASAQSRTARLGVPVVYFCHGLHWSGASTVRSWPPRLVERALLRGTAGVVTLNGEDERWFRDHGAAPLLRLPAGVGLDLDDWPEAAPPSHEGPLRLAWVGELSARKRPLDALAVVRRLTDQGTDVSLSLLGDGPLRDEVRAEAAALPGVDVVGRADPRPVLAASHALLHTASWEGLPRVALEAAATGRPVLGYDVKGLRDAPGSLVAGDAGDVATLCSLVSRWWAGEIPAPPVDRAALDWRLAHAAVTDLLAGVVATRS